MLNRYRHFFVPLSSLFTWSKNVLVWAPLPSGQSIALDKSLQASCFTGTWSQGGGQGRERGRDDPHMDVMQSAVVAESWCWTLLELPGNWLQAISEQPAGKCVGKPWFLRSGQGAVSLHLHRAGWNLLRPPHHQPDVAWRVQEDSRSKRLTKDVPTSKAELWPSQVQTPSGLSRGLMSQAHSGV